MHVIIKDDSNPKFNKDRFDIIKSLMSDGGASLHLPDLDYPRPEGYESLIFDIVEIVISNDAPKKPNKISIDVLKTYLQGIQPFFDNFIPETEEEFYEKRMLSEQIDLIKSIINQEKNNKEQIVEYPYPRYGEFKHEPCPKVILYWGNIKNDEEPEQALEATLVHELFHAWNYFCSDRKPGSIPEINEALVEYATLSFLDRLSQSDLKDVRPYRLHFLSVFWWQRNSVRDKRLGVGLLPAYGFGAYIFEKDKQKDLMRVYPALSGTLSASDPDVQAAVSLLNPLYPVRYEALTLKHIWDALNKKLPNNKKIHIPLPNTSSTSNSSNNTSNASGSSSASSTPSSMTRTERTLFWDIINCPDSSKESNLTCPCSTVLSVQKPLPFRQVPEPWSGDLNNASFMVIGSNPALVENEVFPSKDRNWKNWQTLFSSTGNSFTWNPSSIEDFFVNRFNNAVFPLTGTPYVNIQKKTSLRHVAGMGIIPKRLNNDYWRTYNEYCKAIDPTFVDYSFVVTDFVHCKSGKQTGYKKALAPCLGYMKRIFQLFLSNGQPNHAILLFGSNEKEAAEKLAAIKSIGAVPVGTPKTIGGYIYNRSDVKNKNRVILMQQFSYGKTDVAVYYQIPAPSGQTRLCRKLTFLGKNIKW